MFDQTNTLTPLVDVASQNTAVNGSIASDFRFTAQNDTVNAITASMQAGDTLLDNSTTDNDVINITSTAAMNALTAVNIETANVTMASGAPTAVFTNFTGLTAVNVSGTVAGTVTDAGTATIGTSSYTRVLTVEQDLSGTTAASTANTINVSVSGASYGSTAATRSSIIIDNTDAGTDTVEVLNIASAGTAANTFLLDASTDTDFETINVTGSTDITLLVDHADVTGLTVAAGTNVGTSILSIDRNAATTTATNTLNMSGFDQIVLRDSTAGGDEADLTGVLAGSTIVLSTDFTGADIDVAGTSRTAPAASVTIVLDNATAATDVDIAGNTDIQDVTALNIVSNGNASVSTDAASENALTLVGDATTITITGDTTVDFALNIDGAGAAGTTARAVTVNASGMTGTARAELAASASTVVSYSITGTANADELVLNAAGGTLTGGAGADTLTGGAGADTILGGDGNDAINAGAGTNTVTLGAGVDTLTIGNVDVAAVAQVNTLTFLDAGTFTAGDTITITIGSVVKTYTLTANNAVPAAGDDEDVLAQDVQNFINSSFTGVTATVATDIVTITADTTVDATPTITVTSVGIIALDMVLATGTAGVDAVSVATSVTDFTVGTAGDVISFGLTALNALVVDMSDSGGDVVTGDAVVFATYTAGAALGAAAIDAGANVVKVAYSAAINSAADLDAEIDANNITLDNAMANGDAIATVFYDADNGQAVVGFLVQAGGDGAVLDDDVTFNEVASFTMTQAQYDDLGTANFSFV